MRVLLTGAAGFVGTAIAARLREEGHEVVGVDAMIPQAHGSGSVSPSGVHRVDVRDPDSWRHLLEGVDAVCHQAAMVGAGTSVVDMPLYAGHNDLGTAVLLATMAAEGPNRLVLASSMVVYGEGRYTCAHHGSQSPVPRAVASLEEGDFDHECSVCGGRLEWALVEESAPPDPRSSYAASKVAQENFAAAWARQVSGSVVALRYHNVYGPGMPRDTPYSGVAAIFRSAVEAGRPPQVFEDGRQMRDFVHVDDVARANVLALEGVVAAPPHSVCAYNICSGIPIEVRQVAEYVSSGLGRTATPVITGEYRAGDVRHVVASPGKAAADLGFRARIPPSEGLARFATDPLR
ncbi:NAD-dependent epimerase/dehydratase family protein [Janibacter alittae]|uniref:NAD-dependent epimerase/dehydratase family protein n=1 Tax=Janibacter alittae TaxID=3115209 RepID=A0ABZ2ML26_9MICO